MSEDIFTLIKEGKHNFTKSEQKVAQYVINNANAILQMSISEMADECNVVNSTIFNFCRTLNLHGYQDFKLTLAQSLSSTKDEMELRASGSINKNDSTQEVCQKVLNAMKNAIDDTFRVLDYENLDKAVDYLIKADKILLMGMASSGITAMEAQNKFLRITPKVMFLSDNHIQNMAASLLTKKDVVLAFTYSGITQDIIEVINLAKEAGAKIITVTRFPKSQAAQNSDIVLRCGAKESPLQGGSTSSSITQIFILEVLYEEYFKRTYDTSTKNKNKTAKSIVNKCL